MQMKVSVTSTMFTNLTCKLSKCVCEFRTECSQSSLFRMCVNLSKCLLNSTHCMGIYTQTQQVCSKDPIDGPKDHLSMTTCSKDEHGPRRMILRGLIFEAYLSSTSKDQQYPSRLSFDTDKRLSTYWPSQTRRIVDLVNLQTTKDIVYIQTEYRQSTDTSAPTNSPLAVALSLSSIDVDPSRTSTVLGLRVLKTLMSFQVFIVGGSSKSSRLEGRECINKLPVSCRKCVDKLPLNISSPLSYAREKTLSL
ncbi:hypothetical protein HanPI659440_Chr11g0405211 [Helianthus annuus]|nr:hypothetical protein HanPI659440_Chr11g0405211 [Helianthus annuus]